MAFPTVQTSDVQSGVQTTNSVTWTLTYPTNLISGDLIAAFIGIDGGGTTCTFPGGWTNTTRINGTACCAWNSWKVSDGTETGNFDITVNSEQGGWRVLRITGWFGDLSGTTNNGTNDTNGVKISGASGTSTTPNPASLDPINWATEDTLWIAVCAVDTSRTFSDWPDNYLPGDNTWDNVSGGSGGASLSVQYRQNATGAEDPSTFTISASDEWAAITAAVRPAAAGEPKSLVYQPGRQAAIPRSLYVR